MRKITSVICFFFIFTITSFTVLHASNRHIPEVLKEYWVNSKSKSFSFFHNLKGKSQNGIIKKAAVVAEMRQHLDHKLELDFKNNNDNMIQNTKELMRKNFEHIITGFAEGHEKARAEFDYRLMLLGGGTVAAFFANNYIQTEGLENKKFEEDIHRYNYSKNSQIDMHSNFIKCKAKINCIEDISHKAIVDSYDSAEAINVEIATLSTIVSNLEKMKNRYWPMYRISFYHSVSRPAFIEQHIKLCQELIELYHKDLYQINLMNGVYCGNHNLTLKNARKEIMKNIYQGHTDQKRFNGNDLIEGINKNYNLTASNINEIDNFKLRSLLEVSSFIYLIYPTDSSRIYNIYTGDYDCENINIRKYENIIFLTKLFMLDDIKSIALTHNIGFSYLKLAENEHDSDKKTQYLTSAESYLKSLLKKQPFAFMPYYSYGYLKELQDDYKEALKYYNIAAIYKGENNREIDHKISEIKRALENKISN